MAVLKVVLVFGFVCLSSGLADVPHSRPMVRGKLTNKQNKKCVDQLKAVTCHGLRNLCTYSEDVQALCCDTCTTTKRFYKPAEKTENKKCVDQLKPVTCHGLRNLCTASEDMQALCCNTCTRTKRFNKPAEKTDNMIVEKILELIDEEKEN